MIGLRAIILASLAAAPAGAQQLLSVVLPCADRGAITEALQLRHTESQTGLGIAAGNILYELWTSDETGSWTILRTDVADRSCIVASGQFWTGSAPRLPVEQGAPG